MRVCKFCGMEITSNSRRSYCSEECAADANRIRSRKRYHKVSDKLSTPIKCVNCGKEFIRKQERQKYCCYKCQKEMLYSEKNLRYKIKTLAKIMNFDLNNVDKVLRAKKMLFSAENLHRCPCDAQNPNRFCGSIQCMNDIINKGHCHCHMYYLKNTLQDNEK